MISLQNFLHVMTGIPRSNDRVWNMLWKKSFGIINHKKASSIFFSHNNCRI